MNKTPSQRQFDITSSEARERHFRRSFVLVKHTLWEGGNVLCHCMAGRHRGASGALMFKAIMEGGTLEEADRAVREVRDIEVHKARRQDRNLSAWMEETVQKARLGSAPPLPVGFVATELSMLHLETASGSTLCQHKQRATARQLRDPVRTTDKLEAIAWGRTPCQGCFSLAGAKWQP